MINVLVYIALMGFIGVLYVISVLYIDEGKIRCNGRNLRRPLYRWDVLINDLASVRNTNAVFTFSPSVLR